MSDSLTGKPYLLKQANLSLIRKVIKAKGNATRAEILYNTKISSTTVRSLLTEMIDNGEIESTGFDDSSGGRKAERYRIVPNRYYAANFCITDNQIHSMLVNICGEATNIKKLSIENDNFEQAISSYLDEIIKQKEIKAIGIGVPGIVEQGSFLRKNKHTSEIVRFNIGDVLFKKHDIPVIIENDLNASAIGFSRLHTGNDITALEDANIVYLNFEHGCVSSGIITGGKIVRGHNNFAGELGLINIDRNKTLNECIVSAQNNNQYVDIISNILNWICGILNPQYIVLSGEALRMECINYIKLNMQKTQQKQLQTEILVSSNIWEDYYEGMAYLSSGKIFDEIQLTPNHD